MRLSSLAAGLAGFLLAGALAAQTPQAPPAETQSAPPATTEQAAPPAGEQAQPPAETAPSEAAPPAGEEATPPPATEPAPTPAPAPAETQPAPEATQTPPTPAQPPQGPLPVPPPSPALTPENTWNLDLSDGGRVSIQLRPDVAPQTVARIKALTEQGFYNGLTFHRVIEGFMAQGGDPLGNGTGGSTLPDLPAEINGLPHLRGSVAMARAQDLNSANSQFYIMFLPRLSMDRDYTVFGRVVSGMNYVDAIQRGEPPLNPTRIVRASLGSDNVPEMSAEALRAAGQAEQPERPAAVPGVLPPQPTPAGTSVGPIMPEPGVPRQPEPPTPPRGRGN